MNRTKIEYLTHVWNPVTGCHHTNEQCAVAKHCWARAIARRFPRNYAPGFAYKWEPQVLNEPLTLRCRQARIGVCFMGDLFGDWVPKGIQEEVLWTAYLARKHTLIFLTKAPWNIPKRCPWWFGKRAWPGYIWFGASATDTRTALEAGLALDKIKAPVKFLSLEPLLTTINVPGHFLRDCGIVWVIIGSQTQPYIHPERRWVEVIEEAADRAGIPVFEKNNLGRVITDRPLRQELPGKSASDSSNIGEEGEEMNLTCITCGKPTDICYTDAGWLGLSHGACQCRECYIKNGHPECSNCQELLSQGWKYCPQCGIEARQGGTG